MGEEAVRLDGNTLVLSGGVRVRFIRTLRLPETGTHALPPGLGDFPVRRVADFADSVPEEWRRRGGVMLPMYVREAMWLSFSATEPAALQVGVGKVCAVSGKPWSDRLGREPQNYVVLPRQPWLDGINSGEGSVRQFVAVPMGLGATVEGQVTGEEVWGGVQLQNFALNSTALARWREESEHTRYFTGSAPQGASSLGGYGGPPAPGAAFGAPLPPSAPAPKARSGRLYARKGKPKAMGLGVGGTMRQEIYTDDRALKDWETTPSGRVFVHLVTPPDWRQITGEEPPASPINRQAYTSAGLPWFDYFDSDATDLAPAADLKDIAPVGEWLGDDHEPWQDPTPGQVKHLGDQGKPVADGDW